MIRLGKNIRTMMVLLAGLVILSHSLIPHHHHYNSCFNDNYGAQGEIPCNDESSDKADTHCHAFNTILSEITKALKAGKDVVLTGFGSFTVSKRAARMGRNPQTGAAIKIAAKKVPRFKAGKGLKDAVR